MKKQGFGIAKKLFIISVFTVVSTLFVTFSTVLSSNNRVHEILLGDNIVTAVSYKESILDGLRLSSLNIANMLSVNDNLISAISTGNETIIGSIIYDLKSEFVDILDFDFLVITNVNGRVLFSTYEDNIGQRLDDRTSIEYALRGEIYNDIEINGQHYMNVLAAIPIYTQGDFNVNIGTLSVGYNITSESFVDRIYNQIGAEVTIFNHAGRRLMSSIKIDGERIVNTYLESHVYDYVFEQGLDYRGFATILGKPYYTYYRPFFNGMGDPIGAFFVGQSIGHINNAVFNQVLVSSIISIAFSTILIILTYRFNKKNIVNPIKQMVKTLNQISDGNINIKTEEIKTKNEIKDLQNATIQMTKTIFSIMKDLETITEEVKNGSLKVSIKHDKYYGFYKKLVINVNEMIGISAKDQEKVINVLEGFSIGDFSIPLDDFRGDKRIYNTVIHNLRMNLVDISNQIDTLVENAILGNLNTDTDIDIAYQQGVWLKNLENLKNFVGIILPNMYEASNVIENMSSGAFDLQMKGDYNGIFNDIKNTINSTQENIYTYVIELSKVLDIMSDNDFTPLIKIKYKGIFNKIKESTNTLILKLNDIVEEMSDNANDILVVANLLSQTSISVATGATEQSRLVEGLNEFVEDLSNQVIKNVENTHEVSKLSRESLRNAKDGNRNMNITLEAINEINEAAIHISDFLKVIGAISRQTTLLALNASVEAARAGVHGRGFAVVAQEVSDLAEKSNKASKESRRRLSDILEKIEQGKKYTEDTSKSFETVLQNVENMNIFIQDIEEKSKEQSSILKEISIWVNEISSVVSHNTAISEEAAASSQELNSKAEIIRASVEKYKLLKHIEEDSY
ncbi:MAG: methyl-accepting chemotaxis protein [Defluviitaleaceae bacterium]|nr:methyl-accepting chemotaxis protein [Defluviitaleaceae bacterium]